MVVLRLRPTYIPINDLSHSQYFIVVVYLTNRTIETMINNTTIERVSGEWEERDRERESRIDKTKT